VVQEIIPSAMEKVHTRRNNDANNRQDTRNKEKEKKGKTHQRRTGDYFVLNVRDEGGKASLESKSITVGGNNLLDKAFI